MLELGRENEEKIKQETEPRLESPAFRREINLDGMKFHDVEGAVPRMVNNLDAEPIEMQIASEELFSKLDKRQGEPVSAYVYRGRNRFLEVPIAQAREFRAERIRDTLMHESLPLVESRISQGSVVFFGSGNNALAQRICSELGIKPGNVMIDRFPNSETRIEVHESVRDRQVFVVAGMHAPINEALMETVLLVQALKLADARRITVILPYFGYSRQDRKADTRPPISAKAVTDILRSQGANQILTVDLHATQVEGFFDGPFENLFGIQQIARPLIRDEGSDLVVISPDAGGSKRAEKFARQVEGLCGKFTPLVVMSKFRPGPAQEPTVTFTADSELLKGKTCVLVDDMIDTGGSMIAAARALKQRGAKRVLICASHGIFSNNALSRLQDSCFESEQGSEPLIDRLYVTDTLPLYQARSEFLRVVSVAPLIAEALVRLDRPLGSLRDLKERNDLGELLE